MVFASSRVPSAEPQLCLVVVSFYSTYHAFPERADRCDSEVFFPRWSDPQFGGRAPLDPHSESRTRVLGRGVRCTSRVGVSLQCNCASENRRWASSLISPTVQLFHLYVWGVRVPSRIGNTGLEEPVERYVVVITCTVVVGCFVLERRRARQSPVFVETVESGVNGDRELPS
jgi:hypothetical protein